MQSAEGFDKPRPGSPGEPDVAVSTRAMPRTKKGGVRLVALGRRPDQRNSR